MATNDFLPFATGGGANVLSQSDYAALAAVGTGYQAGAAKSAQLNKTWRQSSIMAAVLGQFIANYSGQNAVDDGTTATLLANLQIAVRSMTKQRVVLADTGAANAYTAVNAPALAALPSSGFAQYISIANANTGAATYAPDGLAAKPIYGLNLTALQGGELVVNGIAALMYLVAATVNSGNGAWILLECTGGALQVAPGTQSQHAVQYSQIPQIQPISASVASNALTATLNSTMLAFRSATLSSGAVTPLVVSSATSLTVPSGATLGTSSGAAATLALLAINNSGTVQLGIVNMASGISLDESALISATAISSGATSVSAIYSSSTVTNCPFRVVGFITATEATAGTWATAPSLVQGASVSLLGFGASLGAPGYQKLPSGMIMQWGNVSANTGSKVTYPITFPGGVRAIVPFYMGSSGTAGQVTGYSTNDATGFTPTISSGSWTGSYIAIGN